MLKKYNSERYQFALVDICGSRAIELLFQKYCPDIVMHLAAESHVDRSISDSDNFIQTNITGTSAGWRDGYLEQSFRHFFS